MEIIRIMEEHPEMLCFKLSGELNIHNCEEFKEVVKSAYEELPKDIFIDAKDLSYIDSTGLGAMISILKVVKVNGHSMEIANLRKGVSKLFYITELDRLFILRGDGQ